MAITQRDFPSLTIKLESIFNETAETAVAEMQSPKLFDVSDTTMRINTHLGIHGLAGIQEVTPGQDLPSVSSVEGDSITYTQRYFGALAKVTKEMRKFDLYNEIESIVRSITDDAFQKVDQSGADMLGNGWNTSYTDVYGKSVTSTGMDGLALFSASHSNNINANVFSNLLKDDSGNADPVLSRAAIVQSRTNALKFADPNGVIRPVNLDTLIVSAANEDLAERIVFSTGVQGTPNVDINPVKGKIKNIITWSRLDTRTGGTDTSAYWYMADSRKIKETLKMLFAERPSLDAPNQVYDDKNWEYSIDYFYTFGFGYPAFIRGSKGTT
jgi:hypothetical protein